MANGGWLSDEHISLAQVLSKQFPEISGLQSPLLSQTNGFLPVMGCERSIQIHNINGNHWVTSYIGYDGELYMYDSSFSPGKLGIVVMQILDELYIFFSLEEGELSSSLTHQLAKIYKGLISKVEDDEGVEESKTLFVD